MTTDTDIERVLEAWLRPGPTDIPDRLLAAIVADVGRLPQRRGLGHARRLVAGGRRRSAWTLASGAIVASIVIAAAAVLLGRPSPAVIGGPSATAAIPTAMPTTSAPAPGPSAIVLTVRDFTFDRTDLDVPAGTPFTIRLVNDDAGVPHGLQVSDVGGRVIAVSPIEVGVGATELALPPLAAGTYRFSCPVHPNETGTLRVGGGTPAATAGVSPAASDPPPDLVITARNMAFDPPSLAIPAGHRFRLELVNADPGVTHGIELLDAGGAITFSMRVPVVGPRTYTYPIDAFPPGTYTIRDPFHPEIRATLTIGG